MSTISTDSNTDIQLLAAGCHYNPHSFLGVHDTPQGCVIRLWRPGAKEIHLEVLGHLVRAERVDERGVFEYVVNQKVSSGDYKVFHDNALLAADPYTFLPQVGEVDTFLFNKGCHYEIHRILGARRKVVHGIEGTGFSVWAPNARSVSLIADCNHFDGRVNPMRSLGSSGVWELFVPGVGNGEKYKFEIRTRENYLRIKSDPMALYSELRPNTTSIVFDVDKYEWNDREWLAKRSKNGPMNIYEVHLGSWKKGEGEFPQYRTIALELASYCKEMGFSHVELLPVMEHPLDESWGYQVTGFFAATSRFGTPTDFQFLVDHLHQEGIGVIVDWVPAHFPTDDFSLNRFDGTALYEHDDPRKGMHPHWQTAIFNYGRREVTNFLIGSALFWLEKMHIDGQRVDAVASMLYLDYGRKEGEWIPNADGSNFNIEAIEFLKHLNTIVREKHPTVWMIAEESSAYSGVTHPDGLGFDLKWNMGWMNDTLRYFSLDPIYRHFHQNDLTFSLLYTFSERFMSVLSHDEVVHGKGSLIGKMPGPDWQKFANVRLIYSYMMCHPGKKLLFMGGEFGQWSEWDSGSELEWNLLGSASHKGLCDCVREINHFYHSHSALWEWDFDWRGYEWIDFSDADRSVISYLRKGELSMLVCVHNFTPETYSNYFIALKGAKGVREVFNTDAARFGGSDKINSEIALMKGGFSVSLAPLATQIFEVVSV